jgi:hypothetical protein
MEKNIRGRQPLGWSHYGITGNVSQKIGGGYSGNEPRINRKEREKGTPPSLRNLA